MRDFEKTENFNQKIYVQYYKLKFKIYQKDKKIMYVKKSLKTISFSLTYFLTLNIKLKLTKNSNFYKPG